MTTKDKIRDLGKELLLRRGYNAFSFSDISTPLGIKNAAIHYHYPTKESLGVDILRKEQERFARWKISSMANESSFEDRLERFFEIYKESLDLELSICLVGSVATDFTTIPTSMKENLKILVSDMTDWLINLLDNGRKMGSFSFPGDPDGMAHTIVSGMAGSLQLSRVNGPTVFHSVKSNFRLQLGLVNV